jgi:hypothetical protein
VIIGEVVSCQAANCQYPIPFRKTVLRQDDEGKLPKSNGTFVPSNRLNICMDVGKKYYKATMQR